MADPILTPDVSRRRCEVCGGRNCYFGFGAPSSDAGVRWYCGRHRHIGQDWWASMRSVPVVTSGSLF